MKRVNEYFSIFLFAGLMLVLASGCNTPSKEPQEKMPVAEETNSESIYLTEGRWDNQHGDTLQLADLEGKVVVASMVFTRCTFACPRIVGDMQAIEKQVPAEDKDKVVFVLVSFDSERDRTAELKQFAQQMNLNDNWLILHGDEESVRELSMVLDVKYKKQTNGDFSHSSSITLLDTKGAIAARVEGLGADPKPIIEKIQQL